MWRVVTSILLSILIPALAYATESTNDNKEASKTPVMELFHDKRKSAEHELLNKPSGTMKANVKNLSAEPPVLNNETDSLWEGLATALNKYANAITAIATALLAIFTLIYVRLTNKLVEHTKRQAEALLDERNNALKREIIEEIYTPMIEKLLELTKVESFRGAYFPEFKFWNECKHNKSFLAYRVREDISNALSNLSEKWKEFNGESPKIKKAIREIASSIFDTLSTVDIVFDYKNNAKNHIPVTILLYRTISPECSIEKLFEGSDVKYALKNHTQKELSFKEFNESWDKVEEKVKQV
jgi:hypothetical protein